MYTTISISVPTKLYKQGMDYGSYTLTAEQFVRQTSGGNLTPCTMRKYWRTYHTHQLSKRAVRAFNAHQFMKGGFTSVINKGN